MLRKLKKSEKVETKVYWNWITIFLCIAFTFGFLNIWSIPDYPGIDKLGHIIEYFIIFVCIYRVVRNTTKRVSSQNVIISSIVITLVYATVDELLQLLISSRDSDVYDWVADNIGIMIGCLVLMAAMQMSKTLKSIIRQFI